MTKQTSSRHLALHAALTLKRDPAAWTNEALAETDKVEARLERAGGTFRFRPAADDRSVNDRREAMKLQLPEKMMRFADLVVLARWLHPIPFRTRP